MKDLKGKVLVGLASVSMLGGIALGSVQGFAALNATSDVQVRFNPYTGGGEDPGDLALAYVPAGFDFGSHNVSPGAQSYAGTMGGANYIAVDDDRSTVGQWKLTAAATALSSTTTTQTISSGNITLTSTSAVRDYDISVGTPNVPGAVGSPISGVTVTRPASSVLTLGGGAVEIASTATSAADQGFAIPIDTVNMNITSENAHGGQTFGGTINWTLSDTL